MKRLLTILALLAIVTAIFAIPTGAEDVESRYVVVFNNSGRIPNGAADDIAEAGGELVMTFEEVGIGIAVSTSPTFADDLKGAGSVHEVGLEGYHSLPIPTVYTEVDTGPTADDNYYELYQWDIRRVNADQAWGETSGSHDTVVAILDTGIAYNHPDLSGNVIYNACYQVHADPCIPYPSYHWHGTHVAGTVAAAFGGGGAVGVGPNLGLANYNVFDFFGYDEDGYPIMGAYDSSIFSAMLDVVFEGFEVINMSLGSYSLRSGGGSASINAWNRVADYVRRQGVTIVASAGNNNYDLNGPLTHVPSDVTGIINVGATGIRPDPFYPQEGSYDVRAFYSNYGSALTLTAPGGDLGPEEPVYPFWWYLVFSTYVYADPGCAASASCPHGYAWAGGTSQAAPHVAGAAGLLLDANPGLSANRVTTILKQTAEDIGSRQLFGHGMVDVYAALTK